MSRSALVAIATILLQGKVREGLRPVLDLSSYLYAQKYLLGLLCLISRLILDYFSTAVPLVSHVPIAVTVGLACALLLLVQFT